MTVNGFFWHGGLGDISMFTVDAKNTHPFTFLYRLQLFSKANSLTLGHVWSQWHYWKFSNASSSIFFILRIQVLVNSSGEIYRICYFCLSQLPKIKKAQQTLFSVKGAGGVTKSQEDLLYELFAMIFIRLLHRLFLLAEKGFVLRLRISWHSWDFKWK